MVICTIYSQFTLPKVTKVINSAYEFLLVMAHTQLRAKTNKNQPSQFVIIALIYPISEGKN